MLKKINTNSEIYMTIQVLRALFHNSKPEY